MVEYIHSKWIVEVTAHLELDSALWFSDVILIATFNLASFPGRFVSKITLVATNRPGNEATFNFEWYSTLLEKHCIVIGLEYYSVNLSFVL